MLVGEQVVPNGLTPEAIPLENTRGPQMRRIYASPGPIYEPEGPRADYWRAARAMHAAGFRAGDLAHNAFSYHMTPGAFIMESGAHALGCTVFPGGTGNTHTAATRAA